MDLKQRLEDYTTRLLVFPAWFLHQALIGLALRSGPDPLFIQRLCSLSEFALRAKPAAFLISLIAYVASGFLWYFLIQEIRS